MRIVLTTGEETIGIIPGKFRKRCWMNNGDVVLVCRREFQTDKVDVLHKYDDEEKRMLHDAGHIPPFFLVTEATCDTRETCDVFVFDTNEGDARDSSDEDSPMGAFMDI